MKNYNKSTLDKTLIDMSEEDFLQYLEKAIGPMIPINLDKINIGKGWRPLFVELLQKIALVSEPREVCIEGAEPRLGRMRIYYSVKTEHSDVADKLREEIISTLIDEAAKISDNIDSQTAEWYEDKLILGGEVYSVSIDTFKELFSGEKDIDFAESEILKMKKINKVRSLVQYLSEEDADTVLRLCKKSAS